MSRILLNLLDVGSHTNAQLRGNNTQAKMGAKRLSLRVIVPVSASERLQLFVIPTFYLQRAHCKPKHLL
jgi:hypothetical protein